MIIKTVFIAEVEEQSKRYLLFIYALSISSDTFDSNYCLCILRMMDGLDIFDQFESEGKR